MARITAIGTFNRDLIKYPSGAEMDNIGGLIYSIIGLSNFPNDCLIYPISNTGNDIFDPLCNILEKLNNVHISGINRCSCPNNVVHIMLNDSGERDEYTELYLPPIKFTQCEPFLDSDLILLNFTSGFELELDTVRKIIDNSNGLVYIDIHSLSLGIDEYNHRFYRKIPEGLKWIAGADFVQMTESEANSLVEQTAENSSPIEIGKKIVQVIKKACLITQGEKGVKIFNENNVIHIPAKPVDKIKDTTGCGDVFGAGFIAEYLKSQNIIKAANKGNEAAARKCLFAGWNELITTN